MHKLPKFDYISIRLKAVIMHCFKEFMYKKTEPPIIMRDSFRRKNCTSYAFTSINYSVLSDKDLSIALVGNEETFINP